MSGDPARLVEHFFRHETGRLHGALIRLLGIQRLSLAEDIAQEAMLRALRVWSMGGVPPNPAAWITRTAMNLAYDALRHQTMAAGKEDAVRFHIEQTCPAGPSAAPEDAQELRDDTLRLLFVCCHPEIAPDAQVMLALKILCGFSNREIARAYFRTDAAVEKLLTRTKQRIQDAGIAFELPPGPELTARREGVLAALYLLFNEGHKASGGDHLLRQDLCAEAIRLTEALLAHPVGDVPDGHALLALQLLTAARFPARQDREGELLRLGEQDRSKWDQRLLVRGLAELAKAAGGDRLSEYHLQAGIAALHGVAPDFGSTDWAAILRHYDALQQLNPSPVVGLNRAVAVAAVHGPQAGLEALAALPQRAKLESHHLLHAVEGELLLRAGQRAAAAQRLRRALELAPLAAERQHLARQLEQIEALSGGDAASTKGR